MDILTPLSEKNNKLFKFEFSFASLALTGRYACRSLGFLVSTLFSASLASFAVRNEYNFYAALAPWSASVPERPS
ncbi:MAG: hypothetical protein ACJ8J7_06115, partial [Sulfurifustaceae bacterium]